MGELKRTNWIDIAKGIGILLVTLGHSRFANSGYSGEWINSFHMPLFFVMAGLCFDETRYRSFWEYFKRKGIALAYPYFMLSVFVAILMTMLCFNGGNYFKSILIDHFPGWTVSGFWFIRVLIVVELLYAFIVKLTPKNITSKALLVAFVVAAFLIAYWQPNGYVYRVNTIVVSMMFYALGYCLRPLAGRQFKLINIFVASLLAIVTHAILVAFLLRTIVVYGECDLGSPIIFFPTALVGIVAISGISIVVDKVEEIKFISKALAWLGKYSILLLAIHGACGICRHSWGDKFIQLAGWPSQILEIALIVLLMWLLSGPLNFFMRIPKLKRSTK